MQKGIIWQGSPACLTIQFLSQCAEVRLNIDYPSISINTDKLPELAVRMLGLNQPIDRFEGSVSQHPQLANLINRQTGLRVPIAASAFEALSWAITGQHISVAAAISLRRKLIQLAGLQHSGGLYCYPDALHIANLRIIDLRQIGFSQNKAQTLLTVSQLIVSGDLELHNHQKEPPVKQISQQLLKIRGIGPWTVNYVSLRGYGCLNSSLHGDSAVRRGLQILMSYVEPPNEDQTRRWLENFSPWRALVAAHLWLLTSITE
ncbi:DNA-3-methyladenine glycosylase [Nitrosomonas sp. Nm51]|uniref:DNA-3-methyladenine glycosylase family protein n=1 Tax=Nitrosomonas sp. Nm51 TaxID=133720 RepID=UPI00210A2F5D|nr:3-methyladenine DNA glycosylase 2 [Nitrosomonas sp. Nm51]